ncbi:hypothetical protein E5M45_17130, partial [Mycobacterium tuberculosis]
MGLHSQRTCGFSSSKLKEPELLHRERSSDLVTCALPHWLLGNGANCLNPPNNGIEGYKVLNRPGMSGDSSSWKGWGHVRWFIEEV